MQRLILAAILIALNASAAKAASVQENAENRPTEGQRQQMDMQKKSRRAIRQKTLEINPNTQTSPRQMSLRERMMARRIMRMRSNEDATDGPLIPTEPLRKLSKERPSARTRRARVENRAKAKDLEHRRPSDRLIRAGRMRRIERASSQAEEPGAVAHRLALFDAANQAREKEGLIALIYNEILETSAQAHAADMLARDYFSHASPEGITPKDRMINAGYGNISIETCHCRYFRVFYGENLAKGQKLASDVITDWLHSPDHREVLLSPDAKETGIGIAGSLWVQHYGSIEMERR